MEAPRSRSLSPVERCAHWHDRVAAPVAHLLAGQALHDYARGARTAYLQSGIWRVLQSPLTPVVPCAASEGNVVLFHSFRDRSFVKFFIGRRLLTGGLAA